MTKSLTTDARTGASDRVALTLYVSALGSLVVNLTRDIIEPDSGTFQFTDWIRFSSPKQLKSWGEAHPLPIVSELMGKLLLDSARKCPALRERA